VLTHSENRCPKALKIITTLVEQNSGGFLLGPISTETERGIRYLGISVAELNIL